MTKLQWPINYPERTPKLITQFFGARVMLAFYRQNGIYIDGHNGIDFGFNYKTPGYAEHRIPVVASHNGTIIFAGWEKGGGNMVKIITDSWVEKNYIYWETVYGHLQPDLQVHLGQSVYSGQILGFADNTGLSTGCHLHFGFKRKYKLPDGRFAELEPNNGYNGNENPLSLLYNEGDKLNQKLIFDLYFGMRNDFVCYLQSLLDIEGLADYPPTGFYGVKTFNSVRALQKKYGIMPLIGRCGPLTRGFLNDKYGS